jgi:hypothetical protein
MKKKNLNYMAGIVDGEGCILIKKYNKIIKQNINPTYELNVVLSNCRPELLEYFKYYFGGSIATVKNSAKSSNQRDCYVWFLTTSLAEEFLKVIYPYLFLKKEEVKLALEFRKTFKTYYGASGTPKFVVDFRETCYKELQKLKRN